MDDKEPVLGVIGSGVMGQGIAQTAASAGIRTLLFDANAEVAAKAVRNIRDMFAKLVGKGRMTEEQAAASGVLLTDVAAIGDLSSCTVVVEAVFEDLDVKQAIFRQLEDVVAPSCILATNTSALSVTEIAGVCRLRERVAGWHFFNPVPLMKLAEVIRCGSTSQATVDELVAITERMGHLAVRAKDYPGFLVNHASRGLLMEGVQILSENVASPEAIDNVMRDGLGFRMGPFEFFDMIGIDLSVPVMESIYAQFFDEPRFRPNVLMKRRLAAGMLGRKTGNGFYEYTDGKRVARETPATTPDAPDIGVWIGDTHADWMPDAKQQLSQIVSDAGWTLDGGSQPKKDSLLLFAPLGEDATMTAVASGADPVRTVAVDLFSITDGQATVMGTPATSGAYLDYAEALLLGSGRTPVRIRDSHGFVAIRVLSFMVNVACEIAQMEISSPDDIDAGVVRGLGYPRGLLAWGDQIGPANVMEVLKNLHETTGDPRYRPSLWLSRRAMLGISLLSQSA